MRIVLFLLLIFPLAAGAQFERSSAELARDVIKEYITTRLFKDYSYQPVSYGEIRSLKEKSHDAAWCLEHKFLLSGTEIIDDKKATIHRSETFTFFFDSKMKVIRAETSNLNEGLKQGPDSP